LEFCDAEEVVPDELGFVVVAVVVDDDDEEDDDDDVTRFCELLLL
jgi:hypothetical protein